MESVNQILWEEITPLNYLLLPPGFRGDQRAVRVVQESLARVIDKLGAESARAQGLTKVITSVAKLKNTPEHTIYLIKEATGNGGAGEVIGLLKVGRKHLYLSDGGGVVRESEPICILDFYVTKERCGYGKRLFDFMLQDQKCTPEMLAVDGPSEKMEKFLRTNYGIERLVRQSNNFAIAPQYFDSPVHASKPSGKSLTSPPPAPTPPTPQTPASFGRHAAPKPQCTVGMVIHGEEHGVLYGNGRDNERDNLYGNGHGNGDGNGNGSVERSHPDGGNEEATLDDFRSPTPEQPPRPLSPTPTIQRPHFLYVPAPVAVEGRKVERAASRSPDSSPARQMRLSPENLPAAGAPAQPNDSARNQQYHTHLW